MIYTKLANNVGPISGFIATGRSAVPRLNIFSARTNTPRPKLTQTFSLQGTHRAVAWSANADYLVVARDEDDGFSLLERDGLSFSTKSVPSNIDNVNAACISGDGQYAAANRNTGTNGRIWHNASGTLTALTSVGSFSDTTKVNAMSSDGAYAAFLGSASPLLRVKVRTGTGPTATYADMSLALQPSSGQAAGASGGLSFSPDDTYLAVSPVNAAHQTVYKLNTGTGVYVKLAAPFSGAAPTGSIAGCAFNFQGDLLAIASTTTTFFYARSGDTFSFGASVSGGNRGGFDPSGNFYITGSGQIYKKRTASSWVAQGSAIAAANAAAFSPFV